MKSDDKTIKTGFGEKARVLEDNRDILPLLLPSVTKPTFQRIIYQLWSEWSDGETKFCIFSLELEAIFKMLFFINIDHSSNKFPPIPGYKSATIWCLLDNDESGHVNVCEHRAPRLPLLSSFKTCSPPRSPKIFSFLSPNFPELLYSNYFSNSTANDSVHLQYFSFPATTSLVKVYLRRWYVWSRNDVCLHLDRNHPDMTDKKQELVITMKGVFWSW